MLAKWTALIVMRESKALVIAIERRALDRLRW